MTGSKIPRTPLTGRRRVDALKLDLTAYSLVVQVGQQRRVGIRAMLEPNRGTSEVARARQISIYLLRVLFGRTYDNIGRLFLRSRSTAQHACQVIEQLRDDDPLVDAEINRIEARAAAAEIHHAA